MTHRVRRSEGGLSLRMSPQFNRRHFLQTSAGTLAAGAGRALLSPLNGLVGSPSQSRTPLTHEQHQPPSGADQKPLRLGLIIGIGSDPEAAIAKVHDLGLPTCQVYVEDFAQGVVTRLLEALDKHQVEATSVVVGGPGREVWDFYAGPLTIGVVPRDTRAARIAQIKKGSDFAKRCAIPAVQTHCGFIPENPNDPVYEETVAAMREVVAHCRRNGQNFRYETGQETPITLVRAIQDVGFDNQGVNFDVANLILYGKANPVDAIEILGPYVQGIHAKDGLWPTNPRELGKEVPIGKGKVDFPRIIARLRELNYQGAITIERETSGPEQIEDVRAAKTYLQGLIG
jgi:L-ribulose-5-phosphate 3-epimerase